MIYISGGQKSINGMYKVGAGTYSGPLGTDTAELLDSALTEVLLLHFPLL